MYSTGTKVSEILKWILKQHPSYNPVQLIFGLMDAFGVTLGAVSSIGGWRIDGNGELKDEDIDRLISESIDKAYSEGLWQA